MSSRDELFCDFNLNLLEESIDKNSIEKLKKLCPSFNQRNIIRKSDLLNKLKESKNSQSNISKKLEDNVNVPSER